MEYEFMGKDGNKYYEFVLSKAECGCTPMQQITAFKAMHNATSARPVKDTVEHKVYIYHITLRTWYKVKLSIAKNWIMAGVSDEYCNSKTHDLEFIEL